MAEGKDFTLQRIIQMCEETAKDMRMDLNPSLTAKYNPRDDLKRKTHQAALWARKSHPEDWQNIGDRKNLVTGVPFGQKNAEQVLEELEAISKLHPHR